VAYPVRLLPTPASRSGLQDENLRRNQSHLGLYLSSPVPSTTPAFTWSRLEMAQRTGGSPRRRRGATGTLGSVRGSR
jgi:hypothetical protein